MAWLGINPFPPGVGTRKAHPNLAFDMNGPSTAFEENALLVRGTLMFETELPTTSGRIAPLLAFQSDQGWKRRIRLTLEGPDRIALTMAQGDTTLTASLSSSDFTSNARVRISYCWDAPARTGHLTVQRMDRFSVHQTAVGNPFPLPLSDLRDIVAIGAGTRIGNGVVCLAIADHVAPVALGSGLTRGCPVATTEGYKPVERLALGDMVLTAGGRPMPVRWITQTDTPAVGQNSPIRLRAPFFGLKQDIVVSQSQGILIDGPVAEYQFGAETVLVRAEDLTTLHSVQYEPDQPIITYYQILLDSHECIDLGGTWGESLYIGQLANAPRLVGRTALRDLSPVALPRHDRTVARSLRRYEAASLLSELIA